MAVKDPSISSAPEGFSRRTIIKTAAWSVPVIAVTVGTPLAAASAGTAALSFDVVPLVDIEAPYGAQALRVANTGTTDFSGPIAFSTPSWTTVAPFTLAGAVQGVDGPNTTWTIPAAAVPAGQSILVDLSWSGPFPASAEVQPITATISPASGSITPVGTPTVASAYALLWYAVTPGGAGNVRGTPSIVLGNTTETSYATATLRMPVWGFPMQSVTPITIAGTTYGVRAAENGQFIGRYADMPVDLSAREGRQVLPFTWTLLGTNPIPQQSRNVISVITGTGETLSVIGSPTVYSSYRP